MSTNYESSTVSYTILSHSLNEVLAVKFPGNPIKILGSLRNRSKEPRCDLGNGLADRMDSVMMVNPMQDSLNFLRTSMDSLLAFGSFVLLGSESFSCQFNF